MQTVCLKWQALFSLKKKWKTMSMSTAPVVIGPLRVNLLLKMYSSSDKCFYNNQNISIPLTWRLHLRGGLGCSFYLLSCIKQQQIRPVSFSKIDTLQPLSGFAQAWKVLENEGSLEKSLKTKFVLKSPWKLTIDLEKYLNFTFSCVLDNFKSLWESKVKFLKKSARFE